MFKLESYITPIILSYVDRYIKNFRLEDSQVSLWGGDASFHNLDLRLEVLEQELQLPFSFVSGHIRELLIHVPWTKLASEPITITINTIECILKLRGSDSSVGADTSIPTKEKYKRPSRQEVEAPPSYVQMLINKIVSNIRIYCNNLILKYVEEDIVLSMNVKLLKFESANESWNPAYTELSSAQVILRKIISVNDLTLCLDKRNAAGKIDIYQEPMLYRCSMTMHLLRHYHSATASRASTTRLDIYCNNMEFGMTEQQVPMLMRLLMLLFALQQKQLKPQTEIPPSNSNIPPELRENSDDTETWTGWAWSYVSSVLPAPWDEEWNNEQLRNQSGHTVHIGFYVDNLSITFKVSEASSDRGYYAHKKMRYLPLLVLQLQEIYCENVSHGMKWFNSSFGISQAMLYPIGFCSCSYDEMVDGNQLEYLQLGSLTNNHKADSLFDTEAIENKGEKRQYNTILSYHMLTNSESVLLERTPAVAFDYVYQVEVPSDMTTEMLSELGSNFEFSNLSETSTMRFCVGPFNLRICSGFLHRISSLKAAASQYDYPPYSTPKPDLPLNELLPPSEEDFDALSEFISNRSMHITFFAPVIELQLMDHPFFQPTKGNLFRKRKKISSSGQSSLPKSDLPKITIECQFLDISYQYPMYINRLVHTTCQLPEPPKKLFDACYSNATIKLIGLSSRLILTCNKHTTILTPCGISYMSKNILKPQYWTNPDIPHCEHIFESECFTLNGTKAKIMVVAHIIDKIIKREPDTIMNSIQNSTLLADAGKECGLPYLELCIESIRFKKVRTSTTISTDFSLGSIKAFIFESTELKIPTKIKNLKDNFHGSDIQQILFVSGPEPTKSEKKTKECLEELPLFTATMQYPLTPDRQTHPPILMFNLQEVRICVDPLLCRWLLYAPKSLSGKLDNFDPAFHRNKNISEASGSVIETPRRLSSQIESVHSSSDREQLPIPPKIRITTSKEDGIDLQERIYNVLKIWFDVWKGMLLYGDLSQCTIYFPMLSLSAVGSRGIQEAVEQAIHTDNPPDIIVITLPFANIRSSHRQNISKVFKILPVKLSETVWSTDKSSFPWTMSISELSCYTVQNGQKLTFLQPVSLSATVGLSTRPTKSDTTEPPLSVPLGSPTASKIEIGYLGVCVHIDMSPVLISTSEVQVYLFASILYGIVEVIGNLMPDRAVKQIPKSPEVITPIIPKSSSTLSPTILRENTLESLSEKTPPLSIGGENIDTDSVKLTAWVQWTITRFTIELLSTEYNNSATDTKIDHPKLKLVIDAEDIVSSLDFQSVYLKIKNKIGSVSVQHYRRCSTNSKWNPGPFSGIVMRLREDVTSGQRHEDNGFISLTVTRASCKHTHTLWGANQKRQKNDKKHDTAVGQLLSLTRYITEIVVTVQPIDFILSLKTLKSFYAVMLPLLHIPLPEGKGKETESVINQLNNQVLPLAYLDCQDIRVILPSNELIGTSALQDVCIFQVQKICLNPTAVNPICRTPSRPDIYEQAAHARILNVPGSEVEDRQYQLDIVGMTISTAIWEDLDSVFSPPGIVVSNLRGMSENPALEWNNLEQGQPNMVPILNLWQVTERFDISIVAAPAMIFNNTLVCGNSMEINFVTDIQINLSLHQIKLAAALATEFIHLFDPFIHDEGIVRRFTIKFPYNDFEKNQILEEDAEALGTADLIRDSGIDTSDIRSVLSSKMNCPFSSTKTVTDSDKQCIFPRPPNPLPQASAAVPIEILVTGGGFYFTLYQIDTTHPVHFKFKNRKKKFSKKIDEDQGYEASAESIDDQTDLDSYIPLLYFSVIQPNAFFSKHHLAKKIQISCFNVNLKLSGPEYLPVSHVPTEQDFPINLIETRSGVPHRNTGILPAFFTLRFTRGLSKSGNLEIEISKPTKVLCSITKWLYLSTVRDKVLDAFRHNEFETVAKFSRCIPKTSAFDSSQSLSFYSRNSKYSDTTFVKFQEIREHLFGTNSVSVKLDQIVLVIESDSGHELHFGFERAKSTISVLLRPEKLCNVSTFESITLTVNYEDFRRIILNPWTISFDICLFWESWQKSDSDPQIQISAESDCIILDVSPEQIKSVEMVTKDIKEFVSSLPNAHTRFSEIVEEIELEKLTSEKEQHYKDDLRAGVFQFVDSNTNNSDELPLAYQVMFWNKNISAMAWRYPQPRALTKVRVFPVPYKMTLDPSQQEDLVVLCHLEYWSECRNCYLPFTQFYLSESEVCHLSLPEGAAQPVVASTWRVVITMINENNSIDIPNFSVSPRALAACMRIDSYFNKNLIPNITAALYITKVDVSLYSYLDKKANLIMPNGLKQYYPDMFFPDNQCIFTLTWDNIIMHGSTWNFNMFSSEICCSTKCSVLDYAFLTNQSFIEPFTSKVEIILTNTLSCNIISKPIKILFGPSIAHTFTVSGQLWLQTIQRNPDSVVDFIVMTRYVICNNTNVNIRFGQTATDEDILLPPKYFHLYAWRTQKRKQQLKIALEENEWIWSKSFSIHTDGIQTINLNSEKNFTILISIKSLSATQKQITISGQLIVSNMLMERFELKVVEAVKENKEATFKNAPTYIASGNCSTPSIFINCKKKYFLRLRFYGLDSAWTGDIPLREHTNGSQPWLVKVPLQERGQFLSIWCRIVIQDIQRVKRVLAMLWPLFTIRSNLPKNAKVEIETPTLNVRLESTIEGKGVIQQLYCPGTIDHSHQLSFQLENVNSSSNPYVPLNYSLVDQHKFFKRLEREDIDDILKVLDRYNESNWPYFGDEMDNIDWVVDEQPLTHVQVRYQNACQYSSSLMVELCPWCLITNTLGAPIAVMYNGVELCRLQHHGIVAPPKLEANFNIAICNGDNFCTSGPLQLAKSDWSQTFYMPKITGTIPLEGTATTAIICDSHICMISLVSSISNEIRLLKISSTHVLSSNMSMQMQVVCVAVPDDDNIYDIPKNLESFAFVLPPHLHKNNSGIPIIKWLNTEKVMDTNIEFALYILFSIDPDIGWSCPIRVDKSFLRKSVSVNSSDKSIPIVLTSQEYKGQNYLSVHYDPRPQMFIENKSKINLFCAQALDDDKGIEEESQHFRWFCQIKELNCSYYTMPIISEKFPELPNNQFPENIVLAFDSEGDIKDLNWSVPISIASDNELYVRIPYYGDIKLSVINAACTTILIIESVSQVEISARDIRVRLSMHEMANTPSSSSMIYQASEILQRNKSNDATPPSSARSAESTDYLARSLYSTIISKHYLPFYQTLPTVTEQSNPNFLAPTNDIKMNIPETNSNSCIVTNKSHLIGTLPLGTNLLKFSAFLKAFEIAFTSDFDISGDARCELANFTVDNIAFQAIQSECLTIKCCASAMQIDNQLYSRESYDFPVVFIGKTPKPNMKLTTLNTPIDDLMTTAYSDALINFEMTFDTLKIHSQDITGVKNVKVTLDPMCCYIEDVFLTRFHEYLSNFVPTRLVMWPDRRKAIVLTSGVGSVVIPELVSWQCSLLARPLTVRNVTVNPISILLSIHCSVKLYIALDQSPLQFGKFERRRLITTPYRLGHAMTMHYLSGAIFGAGWVVSSLELLGSPGGLARAMGSGLRDFVSLPYRGLVQGPMAFLRGITHGSASLMRHVTAGTLQSVTKLASSVARNLDRLTMDEEHLKRTEEQRRQKPQGLAQGFMQGLTGLGISLLGAVGGIAHHPLQSVMADGASPRSLAAGVGLGIVGVITKPLSGAAELVALTGQGLLQGAGWNSLPEPRNHPLAYHMYSGSNSVVKYSWKLMNSLTHNNLLYVTEATSVNNLSQYEAVALILTLDALIIINMDEDQIQRVISLLELDVVQNGDPTLLSLRLTTSAQQVKIEDECAIDMDPDCRARVADYVRSTVGLLNLPDTVSIEHSEISISPLSSPGAAAAPTEAEEVTILSYFVNPQSRNYFMCLLSLAKQQRHSYNFPVL